MRRGTIVLNHQEITFLTQHLQQFPQLPQEVHDRVAALAKQSSIDSEQDVFFNENSIESLLDSLPAPSASEETAATSIRRKLASFLR